MGFDWIIEHMIPVGILSSSANEGLLGIPNLEFWWAASDLAGMADQASVTTLVDKSGKGNDWTCTNLVLKKVSEVTPSGGPIVGGLNWLAVANTAFMNGKTQGEMFAYWLPRNQGYCNFVSMTGETGTNFQDHWHYGGSDYFHWGRSNRPNVGTIVAFNVWNATSFYAAANDSGIYKNGTLAWSSASNTVNFGTTHKLGYYGGNSSANHYLAEVAIFSRKLTTQERADVFAYLSSRHDA